jgi:hypothetical protein
MQSEPLAPDYSGVEDASEGLGATRERRLVYAKAVSKMFDEWDLANADRLTLLGLSKANRSALSRYADGEPLAATRDATDRAGHLLGIYKSLRILYPHNPEFRNAWMSARNRKFGGHTPVEIVRRFGLPGLAIVRGTLDVMRGQ